jgi:hypothetical protein
MPQNSPLTADELVATLIHTKLPTILVEGKYDMTIYRWLENHIGLSNTDILPCGGRNNLLKVYNRKSEFSHLKTAFLADQDMWLFTAIPTNYSDIIWTKGYSIENDIYAGSILEELLDKEEYNDFKKVLESVISWFAFEVEQYRSGKEHQIDFHINQIVKLGETDKNSNLMAERGFQPPSQNTLLEIQSEYKLKIRGKILFDLLTRYLSATKRKPKHSTQALYEIGIKLVKNHVYMERLISLLNKALEN